MSYVDQRMGAGRVTSIVMVAILHALLGYMLVTGMAYKVVKKAVEDLKTFDVNEEPPPPEEKPPPPPEKIEVQPPPIVAPPPIVRVNTAPAPFIAPPPPPFIPPVTTAPPPPPPPPPPKIQPARAKGDLRALFSTDDYPESALRNEEQGTVRVSFTVGSNGRVQDCNVIQSSGSSALDAATCRIIRSRARFTPATDSSGATVADQQTSPSIKWVVPKN
jgi:periplasmic protein TonB